MFRNYLKISIRSLVKNKVFSFINITGLAVGMGLCLLMLMYALNEFSYDNYHENKDRIYRITAVWGSEGSKMNFAGVMPAIAPALNEEVPEIEYAGRILRNNTVSVKIDEETEYPEENYFFADNEILKIFPYDLIEGNINTALTEPYSLILTEQLAQKYFGDKTSLGRVIEIEGTPYTVTGILSDPPENSHFRFAALLSYSTRIAAGSYPEFPWSSWGSDLTYILLNENTSVDECEAKFRNVFDKNVPEHFAKRMNFNFQPLSEIHWDSELRSDIGPKGNKLYAYIFLIASLLVLIIASFNFMNLSTAKYMVRAKEVGIRKVVGASKTQLIKQFLTESVVTASIAVVMGTVLFELFARAIYSFMNVELILNKALLIKYYLVIFSLLIIVGIVAGSYPAFLFSRFKPVKIIRSNLHRRANKFSFRNISVILQFSISIILISAALIIYQQIDFMKNSDLGFDKHNVIFTFLPQGIENRGEKYELLKNKLKQSADITAVSGGYTIPGVNSQMQMGVKLEGADEGDYTTIQGLPVDYDFFDVLRIDFVEGRKFSKEFSTDKDEAVIINESAVSVLGLDNPIGKTLMVPRGESYKYMKIIGVTSDFHVKSMHNQIAPALMMLRSDFFLVAARYLPNSEKNVIADFSSKWKEVFPGTDFEYRFLSEQYDQVYSTEERAGKLILLFTALALFISCLGLFGLVTFIASQRVKEIGIRKVLGASVQSIVNLLSLEFLKWVLAANIIAIPVSYYFMRNWLQNFAYRVDIDYWIFAVSALLAIIISFAVLSFQTIKTAFANPVESLRQE